MFAAAFLTRFAISGWLFRMIVEEGTVQRSDREPASAAMNISREDEAAIAALAEELRVPRDVIAEIYVRELEPLRERARVRTFLPLVVSQRVRRRQRDARRSH